MKYPRKNTPSRVLPLLLLSAVIAGCATTEMTAQWKDPAYGGALTGSRVLVLCQARDDTLRRVCEDQWATRLAAHGVAGIRSYSLPGFPPGGAANPEEMAMAGRESGATAIASTQLTLSDFAVVNPGPQVGFGLGGGSGGGGFSSGGGGGGVSATPMGHIQLAGGKAEFVRIRDITGMWPLVLAAGGAVWLVLRGIRALVQVSR